MPRYGMSEAERTRVRRDIAWGRGGRPSGREIRAKVAKDREEARQRAQGRIDRKRARMEVLREQGDVNRGKGFTVTTGEYKGWKRLPDELTPEERKEEAAATILEVEAAKAEDQNWVTEFTPQQEQEIAGYETAVQRVKSGVISGDIGLMDGGRMVQAINQKIGSYQKIRRPRRKGEPWYPEGQSPGDIWKDESGATVTKEPDGTPKLLVRPDQTPEYMERKTQLALEDKQRQAEEKRALEVEKYMRDLRTEQIEITTGKPGEEKVEKRYRTSAEVYEATLRGYPELAGPQFGTMPQQAQVQQQQVTQETEPLAVQQSREALSGASWFGLNPKEFRKANKTIKDWEKVQRKGNKPISDAEFKKLSPGAFFIHPDGTTRQK